MVRFSLRTLLIVLLVAPPLLAGVYFVGLSMSATVGGSYLLGLLVWLLPIALFAAHFLPLLRSRS